MSFVNNQFVAADFEKENDSTLIGGNDYFDIHMRQLNSKDIVYLKATTFKEPISVNRLALIYKLKGDVSEVYRNDRMASEFQAMKLGLQNKGLKLLKASKTGCYMVAIR